MVDDFNLDGVQQIWCVAPVSKIMSFASNGKEQEKQEGLIIPTLLETDGLDELGTSRLCWEKYHNSLSSRYMRGV